jgi:hypothetical protein
MIYVRFSNRPYEVKHFQTVRHCSVDVAHGLALLFGTAPVDWALGKSNKSHLHHYDGAWHMAQWHPWQDPWHPPWHLSDVVLRRPTSLVR